MLYIQESYSTSKTVKWATGIHLYNRQSMIFFFLSRGSFPHCKYILRHNLTFTQPFRLPQKYLSLFLTQASVRETERHGEGERRYLSRRHVHRWMAVICPFSSTIQKPHRHLSPHLVARIEPSHGCSWPGPGTWRVEQSSINRLGTQSRPVIYPSR